ncbi:hypothetical protein ACGFZP_39095 [Kitasatospora sp. NPDC048239]|uniref:hypothetical protein n=1 Tax=Kitasatospora sp. NPDC048239 TaxID=3364046 RepID=UPI00371A584A
MTKVSATAPPAVSAALQAARPVTIDLEGKARGTLAPTPTAPQALLLKDGVIVDRFGPTPDPSPSGTGRGGAGGLSQPTQVSPDKPWTFDVHGPSLCLDARWDAVWANPDQYSLVVVLSAPRTYSGSGLTVQDPADPLLVVPAPLQSP